MTSSATPDGFRKIFRSLVIRLPPRHLERDAVDEYWVVLQTIPLDVLRQSALTLSQTNTYFPSTGEWFQAAHEVQLAARVALAAEPADPSIVECEQCSDTGWVYVDQADRPSVVACGCRTTNRTYQRKRASEVRRLSDVSKESA
jgi:hypothetical protein